MNGVSFRMPLCHGWVDGWGVLLHLMYSDYGTGWVLYPAPIIGFS